MHQSTPCTRPWYVGALSDATGDDRADDDDGRSLYGDSQGDGSEPPLGGALSEEEGLVDTDVASQDGSVISMPHHDSDDDDTDAQRG